MEQEVNIERALKIDGWMQWDELGWLARQAVTRSRIAEIGSYKGRSTRALADHTPGYVLAVDHWQGPREVEMRQGDRDRLYGDFTENLKDLIAAHRVQRLMVDHAQLSADQLRKLLKKIKLEPQFDMIFIDGDHQYASVKHDIELWRPLLADGGLLCGHDSGFPGVAKAITEFIPGHQLVAGTQIWYWINDYAVQ